MTCPQQTGFASYKRRPQSEVLADILKKPLDRPAAWRGEQFAGTDDWITPFNRRQIQEIDSAVQGVMSRRIPLFELGAEDFPLPTLSKVLAGLRDVIEGGRGFIVLRGLPVNRWTAAQTEIAFWGLGSSLGVPEKQDAEGNLLHHVRDTGKDLETDQNARGYETTLRLPYHNDGADCFMLLCRRSAKRGGRSRLVSAVEAFNQVLLRRPDLAEVLQQDFHFDARGQQMRGEGRCQVHPIYTYHEGHLNVIYKRDYIEFAQRFEEVPRLTDRQIAAMDLLDEVCNRPGIYIEFDLQPGDIQIANNYDTLHARTAFEDEQDSNRKRHCLRLWLTLPNGRPLPPVFERTREFGRTYARRVKPHAGSSAS